MAIAYIDPKRSAASRRSHKQKPRFQGFCLPGTPSRSKEAEQVYSNAIAINRRKGRATD